MRSNMIVAFLSFILFSNPCAASNDVIRAELINFHLTDDDNMEVESNVAETHFVRAFSLCNGDTNRFLDIVMDLAHTNDLFMAEDMIEILGAHGTSAQLPFLYSIVTNEQYRHYPARSILRIEGVTSNSVAMVERCLALTNFQGRVGYNTCDELLRTMRTMPTHDSCWSNAMNVVVTHLRDRNIYHAWLDASAIETDFSYRFSKRRLAVLRRAMQRGVDNWDIGYVTNAINEMVAYPESALGE